MLKSKKLRKPLEFALVLSIAFSVVSCGSDNEIKKDPVSDTVEASSTTAETSNYPDVDYNGDEFRILNFDQLWNMYIHIDTTELNGEVLNDAVYYRNRKVEQELNCVITEKTFANDTANTITRITDHAKTSILSGDCEYDVMYLPVNEAPDLITDNYLVDLNQIPELQLSEVWWDQDIIKKTVFNDKLYFASGASNLMAFESMWCLFFNENMIADLQLDTPYELVREGKWTIDALAEYCKAAATLNGDDSFTWSKNGNCVYGISSHRSSPEHFWLSANEFTVKTDTDEKVSFAFGNDRFYGVMDKLAKLLNTADGLTLYANNTDFDADNGGYVYVFSTNRSLFMTGEVKAAQLLRDMKNSFGIVPFPKYDEEQTQYYTSLVSDLFYLTIPVTNTKIEETATIAEILTRDSYLNVIPKYYNNVVEQKGLRNEASIEMLEIMRSTRTVDIATIFNWNSALRSSMNTKMFAGDSQVASLIESQKTIVESSMQKFFDFLG